MKLLKIAKNLIKHIKPGVIIAVLFFVASTGVVEAATLSISPGTGVYASNNTFTVQVVVNSEGQPINAADGVISFNPRELSVTSINRSSSIFNLWVTEPAFSNSAGTVDFSGGLPSGYTGSRGNIMNITFRAIGSGSTKVSFKSGSVLANDGRGSNVLTSMKGGTFTIQSAVAAPEPEVIEYIAPANTPSTPVVTSETHPNREGWSQSKEAELAWILPAGITGVRTLLNDNPTSVPTRVYENPINELTISDLEEGISYFHLQFRNSEGWGRVAHYRLGVDSEAPSKINISLANNSDLSNPIQTLNVVTEDGTSAVDNYRIKINNDEPFDYIDETGSSTVQLPNLEPGYHSVIVEAFDEAGNSIVGTFSFTIESFEKPIFTEIPSEINQEVIPVIKGETRPNSQVEISLNKLGTEPKIYQVNSDSEGVFVFIPEGTFSLGVYEISARATDKNGARSEVSEKVRIAVQQPGYLQIGSYIISVLSVLIPLLVLLFILVFGVWYLIIYSRRFRKSVRVESKEALEILNREFSALQTELRNQESLMQASRKTKKLTNAESAMVESLDKALQNSQNKVVKEIDDIRKLVRNDNK